MNYSESVISSARAASDASSTGATAQTILLVTVMRAILLATLTPANTATASVAGATTANLQYLLEVLHTSGYTATVSGTTLTVSW
jgi:hypothetical protein